MKTVTKSLSRLPALLAISTCLTLAPTAIKGAGHGDAPALDADQGADIADFFMFPDTPTQGPLNGIPSVVLIGTVHGFIVPGEAGNFAAFDPNVRFRFELYNDHVNILNPEDLNAVPPQSPNHPIVADALTNFLNPPPATQVKPSAAEKARAAAFVAKIVPNLTIDVAFAPRAVVQPAPPTAPLMNFNLVKPGPQAATITFTGFKPSAHFANHGVIKTASAQTGATGTAPFPILSTASTQAATALTQTVNTLDTSTTTTAGPPIQFFAGEVADPFFFDLTAFSLFIKSCQGGSPDTSQFTRARNSFSGYNVLAIAIELPLALVQGTNGAVVGADFLTQRHAIQEVTSDGTVGMGGYKTVDRIGNPAINVALIPFNDKDKYNGGTPHGDAALHFAGDILTTVKELGLGTLNYGPSVETLVYLEFDYGDILKLNPSVTAGYPNGRLLTDDTITTILTVLNNGNATSDNVTQEVTPQMVFPFVALPYQPQAKGATIGADDTQN